MKPNPLLVALISPTAESFEAAYGWSLKRGEDDSVIIVNRKAGAAPSLRAVSKVGVAGMGLLGISAGTAVVAGTAALLGKHLAPGANRTDLVNAAALAYAAPTTAILLATLLFMPKRVAVVTADPSQNVNVTTV